MRLKHLEEQAMFALKTSCENFENPVFPNAMIAGDCAPLDATISPAAEEVCDGIDNDCDGVVNESCQSDDWDGDGASNSQDCDPTNSAVYPGADEPCCLTGGLECDFNCDGNITACAACDNDGDGYCPPEDCDDSSNSVYPGAPERCDDGIDQDCNNIIDDAALQNGDARGESVLDQLDLRGKVQVVSFHPDFIFSEEKLGDPGAFTNRAPYPLLHILREKDVTEAVNSHPNVRGIPKANVERMREIGNESLKRMLDGLRSL